MVCMDTKIARPSYKFSSSQPIFMLSRSNTISIVTRRNGYHHVLSIRQQIKSTDLSTCLCIKEDYIHEAPSEPETIHMKTSGEVFSIIFQIDYHLLVFLLWCSARHRLNLFEIASAAATSMTDRINTL